MVKGLPFSHPNIISEPPREMRLRGGRVFVEVWGGWERWRGLCGLSAGFEKRGVVFVGL